MSFTRKERRAARKLEKKIAAHLKPHANPIWFTLDFANGEFKDISDTTVTVTIAKYRGAPQGTNQHPNSTQTALLPLRHPKMEDVISLRRAHG